MVKKIVKGKQIFARKAQPATKADKQVVTDLMDTLRENREICVGMAANMIGVNKSIIVVAAGPFQFAMVNPVITKKSGEYTTEEGCLSLDGVRNCIRYEEIEVDYLNENFEPKHGKFSGYTELLDAGCGPAPMISLLSEKYPNRHYTGLDLTLAVIEQAKKKKISNKIVVMEKL